MVRGPVCCVLAALVLFAPVALLGQEVGLEFEVGFGGLFQLGRPFPLELRLQNFGPAVEGTVEVKVWKGGPIRGVRPYPFYYRKAVFLAARSRKSLKFTIDPDSIARPVTASFQSERGRVSKEINLRGHFSPAPLILVLAGGGASPSIPLGPGFANPFVGVSVADLPSEPRAYQSAAALILYEASLRDLSAAQAAALETWLSSGGRLIILGSFHYALYQEPSLSQFLPVRVVGLKRIPSVPALERAYGGKSRELRDLWSLDSRPLAGTVLIEENGIPILVEMSRGRGRVFYLSLDVGRPPLSRWGGLSRLIGELLSAAPATEPPSEVGWNEAVFSQLIYNPSFISAYLPLRGLLFWIAFYLGGFGLLAWLWRRKRFSRHLLAVSSVALVIFSSAGGYLHFNRGGAAPDGVLFAANLLDGLPDGYAEVRANVALFSTQRRVHAVRVESGWNDLEPVPRRATEDPSVTIEEEGGSSRLRFALKEWDYRLFRLRSVVRFPFRVELQPEGEKVSLKLSNLSAYDVAEAWLVLPGQRFFVGDVPRGSTQVRKFSLLRGKPAEAGRAWPSDLWEIPFSEKTRELLFRYSFFPQERGMSRWGPGSALFFGWVKGFPRRVHAVDQHALVYHYTFYRAILPLGDEEEL